MIGANIIHKENYEYDKLNQLIIEDIYFYNGGSFTNIYSYNERGNLSNIIRLEYLERNEIIEVPGEPSFFYYYDASTVPVTDYLNFGFNFIENDFKVDRPMLLDTAIDTAISVGSFFSAVGLVTLGVALLPFSVPGTLVVGGVILLSIGIEYLFREVIGYGK